MPLITIELGHNFRSFICLGVLVGPLAVFVQCLDRFTGQINFGDIIDTGPMIFKHMCDKE